MSGEDASMIEDPSGDAAFSRRKATEHLMEGDARKESGDSALALSHYERSLAYDYSSPRARTLVAELRASLSPHDSSQHPTLSLPKGRLGAAASRYRLLREIGRGGMGAVYLASDMRLVRRVALKVFHEAAGRSARRVDRMLDEARVVSAMSHPGVVRVLDLDPDHRIIVMEYLGGASLRQRLRQGGPLSSPQVEVLAHGLASVLAAIHDRGLVHGDLKPANVLFREDGPAALADPVLADFGLAQVVGRRTTTDDIHQGRIESRLNLPLGFSGTLAFMAPEARRGAPPTVATDLFALGVMLFEARSGYLPFEERALLSSALPRPVSLPSEVLAPLRDLIFDLLASSPGDRPTDAGEVITRLDGP